MRLATLLFALLLAAPWAQAQKVLKYAHFQPA